MKPAQKLPDSSESEARPAGRATGAETDASPDANNNLDGTERQSSATAEQLNNPRGPRHDSANGNAESWVNSPLGRLVDAQEQAMVAASLPRLYNPVCVQIGGLGGDHVMGSTEAALKVMIGGDGGAMTTTTRDARTTESTQSPGEDSAESSSQVTGVRADPTALPFGERSVDLALLVHALDFSSAPHQVLREVDQILAPDGHVVILGFNPLSLFGLRRLVGKLLRRNRNTPWSGSWLRLSRIQDWLALLGYESTAGVRSVYTLPFQSQRVIEKFDFLERAGNRWWPRFGAVYVIVAKKREIAGTPLPAWRTRRRKIGQRIAGSVTRDAGASSQTSKATVVPWRGNQNE